MMSQQGKGLFKFNPVLSNFEEELLVLYYPEFLVYPIFFGAEYLLSS